MRLGRDCVWRRGSPLLLLLLLERRDMDTRSTWVLLLGVVINLYGVARTLNHRSSPFVIMPGVSSDSSSPAAPHAIKEANVDSCGSGAYPFARVHTISSLEARGSGGYAGELRCREGFGWKIGNEAQ